MSRPFVLPDLGEGLTEAEIVKVLVREGDVIAEDAPLLEVEDAEPAAGFVDRGSSADRADRDAPDAVHVGE